MIFKPREIWYGLGSVLSRVAEGSVQLSKIKEKNPTCVCVCVCVKKYYMTKHTWLPTPALKQSVDALCASGVFSLSTSSRQRAAWSLTGRSVSSHIITENVTTMGAVAFNETKLDMKPTEGSSLMSAHMCVCVCVRTHRREPGLSDYRIYETHVN